MSTLIINFINYYTIISKLTLISQIHNICITAFHTIMFMYHSTNIVTNIITLTIIFKTTNNIIDTILIYIINKLIPTLISTLIPTLISTLIPTLISTLFYTTRKSFHSYMMFSFPM